MTTSVLLTVVLLGAVALTVVNAWRHHKRSG